MSSSSHSLEHLLPVTFIMIRLLLNRWDLQPPEGARTQRDKNSKKLRKGTCKGEAHADLTCSAFCSFSITFGTY